MRYIYVYIVVLSFLNAQPELRQYVHQDIYREYILYRPICEQSQSPLVFVFHGYTGSASGIMEYSNMNLAKSLEYMMKQNIVKQKS